jgi:hypothetical protein
LTCAFEKLILRGNARCGCSERFCIGERHGVDCGDAGAQQRCEALLQSVTEQCHFALKDQSRFLSSLNVQLALFAELLTVDAKQVLVEDIDACLNDVVLDTSRMQSLLLQLRKLGQSRRGRHTHES